MQPCLWIGAALHPDVAPPLIAPQLLLLLCLAGAVAMVLLLPSAKESPLRAMGGIVLLALLFIVAVIIGRAAAGPGIFFWIFSAVALICAVRVITHTKPVYSALYFVMTVMASAGLFVLLWAEFMAAALILIYGGAILVTYVFVIMLASEAAPSRSTTGMGAERTTDHDQISREPILASAVGFALIGVLLFVIFDRAPLSTQDSALRTSSVSLPGATQQLGDYLFRTQVVSLELAGLLLTVAMVGAIVIARRRVWRAAESESVPEVLHAPATPIDDNPHSIPVTGTLNPRQKAYPET